MYLEHFELAEFPFSLTPDTEFFLNQGSHKEALNTILVALKHCEGFIKIVGEVGTGKTMLCRVLLSRLNTDFVTSYIPNPYLSPEELKYFIAKEIGAHFDKAMPAHELMSAIYRRLVQLSRSGKQVVVVIDEAQAMPRDTVESLRLLTNLETEKRKLLQVVMFGQPELDKLLSRPDLRQLKQRIVFQEYLQSLNFSASKAYVRSRLDNAGVQQIGCSSAALIMMYLASGGVPRLINILCHKALIAAYGRGHKNISLWHIARAVVDTTESRKVGSSLSSVFSLNIFCPKVGAPS
jgi:MSHA biogenesis protein MshM